MCVDGASFRSGSANFVASQHMGMRLSRFALAERRIRCDTIRNIYSGGKSWICDVRRLQLVSCPSRPGRHAGRRAGARGCAKDTRPVVADGHRIFMTFRHCKYCVSYHNGYVSPPTRSVKVASSSAATLRSWHFLSERTRPPHGPPSRRMDGRPHAQHIRPSTRACSNAK